jgi:hypothetical protein
VTWVNSGKAAAPTLDFDRDASGAPIRDADGQVKGGVRISQFTVPTAMLATNGKSVFCLLSGHHRDFTPEELKARYGSHEAYVERVRGAMRRATEAGYILPFDMEATVKAAEVSNVAR